MKKQKQIDYVEKSLKEMKKKYEKKDDNKKIIYKICQYFISLFGHSIYLFYNATIFGMLFIVGFNSSFNNPFLCLLLIGSSFSFGTFFHSLIEDVKKILGEK